MTELCKLFQETPTTILLPVIYALQRRVELNKTLVTELHQLTDLQRGDFHRILEKSLAPASGKMFPIREWHSICEHIEIRRYRFASVGIELLKLAEEFYRSRQDEEDLHTKLKERNELGLMEQYLSRFPAGIYTLEVKRKRDNLLERQQAAASKEAAQQQMQRDRKLAEEADKRREAVLKSPNDKQARRYYLNLRTDQQKAIDASTSAWHPIYYFWLFVFCSG